jgi:hypothetical protein
MGLMGVEVCCIISAITAATIPGEQKPINWVQVCVLLLAQGRETISEAEADSYSRIAFWISNTHPHHVRFFVELFSTRA